jgi:hypothetical protein
MRVAPSGTVSQTAPAADAVIGRLSTLDRLLPLWIAPITLYGLLITIVLLFAIQGDRITAERPSGKPIAAASGMTYRCKGSLDA